MRYILGITGFLRPPYRWVLLDPVSILCVSKTRREYCFFSFFIKYTWAKSSPELASFYNLGSGCAFTVDLDINVYARRDGFHCLYSSVNNLSPIIAVSYAVVRVYTHH